MKVQTIDRVKFKTLKMRLRLPQYAIIGILEGLWYLTATNAPDGGIGRFSDEEIAAWLEYPEDGTKLIDALVATRWLDRSEATRLMVHDWAEHCPVWVKGIAARQAKGGGEGAKKRVDELSGQLSSELSSQLSTELSGQLSTELSSGLSMELSGQLPIQYNTIQYKTIQNQSNPPPAVPASPVSIEPEVSAAKVEPKTKKPKRLNSYPADFEEFWAAFPPIRKQSKPNAFSEWQKAIERIPAADLLAAVIEFAASPLGNSEWCPGPAPWLHQDRWADDRAVWRREAFQKAPAMPQAKTSVVEVLQLPTGGLES